MLLIKDIMWLSYFSMKGIQESTIPAIESLFQRKFSVEFLDNLDAVKKKTSNSKKTCRALFSFFTERIATEQAYAARLAELAKNGLIIFYS